MRLLTRLRSQLNRLLEKPIVQGTLWLLIGKGLRVVLQAIYFVVIARTLGVENYGAFVGMTALVAIVSPFVGVGIDTLLLKNVAKNRNLVQEYWGNALWMILVTGISLMGLLAIISPFLLPKSISLLLISIVAVSDLIFGSISNIAGRAFQAVDRLNISAQINVSAMFLKVLAAIALMLFFPEPNPLEWVCLYLASSIMAALFAAMLVRYYLGAPKLALRRIMPELMEGISFSISTSAYTIYNDIDKTMLAKLSTLEATGIYAAAYRLIDVAFIPVMSISGAAYADFFRKGKDGISATLTFAKPLIAITATYSVVAGIGLIVLAPVVPQLLGSEYNNVVDALRLLAPIPLFRSLQNFGGDILSGAGFQGVRSIIEVIISVFNILINLLLIPLYHWQGAAWSSLASDGLLMTMLWLMVAFQYHKQKSKLSD
jgi:O-antigen/teichoic acid export membrane protein